MAPDFVPGLFYAGISEAVRGLDKYKIKYKNCDEINEDKENE